MPSFCAVLLTAGLLSQPPLVEDRLRLPPGTGPAVDCVAVDLDGDGLLDLVRAGAGRVAVLHQDRLGRFAEPAGQAPITIPAAERLQGLAAADLRGVGRRTDIVVAVRHGPPRLLVADNRGLLSPAAVQLPAPAAPVAAVLAGDLDGSGPDDLLVLLEIGVPQLLAARTPLAYRDDSSRLPANLVLQAPRGVIADVSGDGRADVVLGSSVAPSLLWLEAPASSAAFVQRSLPLRTAAAALAVGDLTGNGRLDVVVAGIGPDEVRLILNQPTGFVGHTLSAPFPTGGPAADIAIADVDGSGTADVAVVASDGRLRIGLGDGRPSPSFTVLAWPGEPGPRARLLAVDLEADGDVDLVLPGAAVQGVWVRDAVLLGAGGGLRLRDTEAVGIADAVMGIEAPVAATFVDLDGDGDADLAGLGSNGQPTALVHDGSGRFRSVSGVLPGVPMREVSRVLPASITSRGRDLVVVASAASGSAAPPGVRLLVAGAGGRYVDASGRLPAAAQQGFADVAVGAVVRRVAAGDDLVLADGQGGLLLFANSGTAYVAVAAAFQTVNAAVAVARLLLGDLDGDGAADLVVVGRSASTGGAVRVFLRQAGNAAPLFVEQPSGLARLPVPRTARLGDVDGDGRLDLVVPTEDPASPLLLLRGDGAGGFVDATARLLAQPPPLPPLDAAIVTAPLDPPVLVLASGADGPLLYSRFDGARYAAFASLPVHGCGCVSALVVGDVDGDFDDDCALLRGGLRPSLLFGAATQLAQRGLTQGGRPAEIIARAPAGSVAALLWSAAATRVDLGDLGVLRLAAPTSLSVFPVPASRVQALRFPTAPVVLDVRVFFQMAVLDFRSQAVRLSNVEPFEVIRQ